MLRRRGLPETGGNIRSNSTVQSATLPARVLAPSVGEFAFNALTFMLLVRTWMGPLASSCSGRECRKGVLRDDFKKAGIRLHLKWMPDAAQRRDRPAEP